ncbi:hypothetical protein SeLEV6574_g03642 [Synchytrium endobioticum]|uniref:Uncharacterized protein n=1 Tax=Synchytrium endobioticum TaxID=286115 RepID=A0A507D2W0_9FUNG|nr:hypothetical protein SeLEV6574_g03642 [Synchytrium endobioticum]
MAVFDDAGILGVVELEERLCVIMKRSSSTVRELVCPPRFAEASAELLAQVVDIISFWCEAFIRIMKFHAFGGWILLWK